MITIDGSKGEGGGQILRSALSLSLLGSKPFRMRNVRKGRARPGLLRQHLCALNACAQICDAKVQGAELGSLELSFEPGQIKGGEYHFKIGSAGSTGLVLQTVLLPLLSAPEQSRIILEGGTHNPWAPPFDFLDLCFLPILRALGSSITIKLERPGFYPSAGGKVIVDIEPSKPSAAISLLERGELLSKKCRAIICGLSPEIAKRELDRFQAKLGWDSSELRVEQLEENYGPGNALCVELKFERHSQVFCSFGQKGLGSDKVADALAEEVSEYLQAGVCVDRYLADQLLMPGVWSGGARFNTLALSSHFHTNLELIKEFLKLKADITPSSDGKVLVDLKMA